MSLNQAFVLIDWKYQPVFHELGFWSALHFLSFLFCTFLSSRATHVHLSSSAQASTWRFSIRFRIRFFHRNGHSRHRFCLFSECYFRFSGHPIQPEILFNVSMLCSDSFTWIREFSLTSLSSFWCQPSLSLVKLRASSSFSLSCNLRAQISRSFAN